MTSAFDSHEQPASSRDDRSDQAAVSFIMPVLNEADYLAKAVASIERQNTPSASEIVLALGPSTDGTTEIAERLAQANPAIRLVHNPVANISAGLNAAIKASQHPVIVRVDAHTELSDNYVIDALRTLTIHDADNVGGVMHAAGETTVQRAAARAYNSRLGLGGPAYHVGGAAGEAESAYLGVFRRDAAVAVGLFDEATKRGEDWEFNLRLRQAGYRVWFDPGLRVTYRPRGRFRDIARQFFATGMWRGELSRRSPRRASLRYFAPPVLVITLVLAAAAGLTALFTGIAGGWWVLTGPLWAGSAAYAVAILASALSKAGGSRFIDKCATVVMLPTMHVSWGTGFLRGFLTGAGGADDTSRVTTS